MSNEKENEDSKEKLTQFRYLTSVAEFIDLVVLESTHEKQICVAIEFPESVPVAIPWEVAWDLSRMLGNLARKAQIEEFENINKALVN